MDLLEKFLHKISYKFPKGYPDVNDPKDKERLFEEFKKLGINLNEVKLSVADLQKPFPPRNELAGKYEDRGERFLEKIKNGDPFILTTGESVILDPTQSQDAIDALSKKDYLFFSKGSKVLFDKEGNSYSLSNFEKTKEFGSGSGMGGGAQATDIQESSQCVVNSIAYNIIKGEISPEDLIEDNINKAYSLCDVSSTLEECKDFILNQSTWVNTFINSANLLYNNYPNNNFQQHRGSKFVENLYKAFNSAKKSQGLSFQADKWNPADIWMVDKSILNTQFPIELGELNALLTTLFIDNKLIGVSLKKTSQQANLSVYNLDEEDFKGYEYEGYDSRKTNNNTVIIYNDGSITFRTFNFATNFAGEIKGKTAAHGKIGMGAINDILKDNQLEPLPPAKEIQNLIKSLNSNFIEDFTQTYSKIVTPISKEEMETLIEEKDLNFIVSKYLSTSLAFKIDKSPKFKQDEIISDIIRYASSSTKNSSVFVKIS